MTPQQKEEVGRAVLAVMESEYYNNLADVVATTVGITESIPEQANNEIRNAFNHLARAYASSTVTEANNNIRLAKGHLERANRDCLKIAVIHMRLLIEKTTVVIEDKHGIISTAVRRRIKGIIVTRNAILASEAKGEPEIATRLYGLLSDCSDLYEYLLDNYTIPGIAAQRFSRIWRFTKRVSPVILLGIIGSLVAAFIFAYVFPEGNAVRQLIDSLKHRF